LVKWPFIPLRRKNNIKANIVYKEKTLVNSLHGLLNCEIGGLDSHVVTTEYRTRVHCVHHM